MTSAWDDWSSAVWRKRRYSCTKVPVDFFQGIQCPESVHAETIEVGPYAREFDFNPLVWLRARVLSERYLKKPPWTVCAAACQ
jgi:hypothetical protein